MPRKSRRNGFGTIISVGTATRPAFVIRWFEGSKRKQKSGFNTRTDAAEALARVRVGLGDGTLVEKRKATVAFDAVARDWLRLKSAPNLRSHDDNLERYEKHVAPFFGDCPLTAVTPTRILEFRAKLQASMVSRKRRGEDGKVRTVETKMAPRTVNLILALVRVILRFAVRLKHIPISPIASLDRGELMLSVEKTKMAPPIEDAAAAGRLLAAVREIGEETNRPSIYPLLATLLYTGARRGEAAGLIWPDVDFPRRMITIRHSYSGPTKSAKHRQVPMPPELVDILKAYKVADPWKRDLVFPDSTGEMYSPDSKVPQTVLWAALERAGLPRIRIHDLRHAYASFMLMAGSGLADVQDNLGHSTPVLTKETYGHLAEGHRIREASRISFPAPPPTAKVLPFVAPAPDASNDVPDAKRLVRG
jgi:integrase